MPKGRLRNHFHAARIPERKCRDCLHLLFDFTRLIDHVSPNVFPCLSHCPSVPYRIVRFSPQAKQSWPIIQRANYVSGRDQLSVTELSSLLGRLEAPRAKPHEVERVRDPILSDEYFMDVEGTCWKQSEGTVGER